MDCTDWRTVLSSVLDDEASTTERAAADAHVATCPGCASWLADARSLRLTVAEPVPDLTAQILSRHRSDVDPHRSGTENELRDVWRVGLAVVALAQALVGLGALLGPAHAGHLAVEHGAWELALAAGFATAAWKPARADGLVPLVAVLAVGLVLTAGAGDARLADEGTHLVPLVGLGLLVAERRIDPHAA